MTRITLETRYGRYVVEVPDDDLDISRVLDALIKPVLLAAGFVESTVDKALCLNE